MAKQAEILSLAEYFKIHGDMIHEPRVVLPFHRDIMELITRWILGTLPDNAQNLAICMPPGHGKTYIARDVISWASGLFPDAWWIYASYSATLAMAQTQAIKETMTSDWYKHVYPDSVVPPYKGQRGSFKIGQTGMVYATGAGGSITGFRAGRKREGFSGGIIIDDPVKALEGLSPTRRKKVQTWYTNTMFSRKSRADTPVLLIMQRLHEDDLVGFVKKKEPDKWHIYTASATIRDESGDIADTIWPVTFSPDAAKWLRETDQHTFYSQYEQDPTPQDAGTFKQENFCYWSKKKDNLPKTFETVIITADTAYKAKEVNDYTVFQTWGRANNRAYLLGQIRRKCETPEAEKMAESVYHTIKEKFAGTFGGMYIEDKASGISIIQHLNNKNLTVIPVSRGPLEAKAVRASMAAPYFAARQVYLPEDAPWLPEYEAEMLRFNGAMTHEHDDQVDATVDAIKILLNEGVSKPWVYGNYKRDRMTGYIIDSARGRDSWLM